MSRRDQIRMTDDEVRDYLRDTKTLIINSIGPGGFPHPMPMWFAVDEKGVITMTTFRKSQKVLNIQRDPKVSLLAESGTEYAELRGVVIYGHAEVIDDIDVVKATLYAATVGDVPEDPKAREAMDGVISNTAAKRVCIRIEPERVVSWDHRKLGGVY